jgi:hypothetical protein
MSGDGVISLEFATGEDSILFDPPQGAFASAFSVSPDHHWMVVCAYQGAARDLHLVDLTGSTASVQLTNDGKSCDPAW